MNEKEFKIELRKIRLRIERRKREIEKYITLNKGEAEYWYNFGTVATYEYVLKLITKLENIKYE